MGSRRLPGPASTRATERTRRPTRSRWIARAGLAMVLVGLVLLGHLGWQYVGTNWVSVRRHHQIVHQLRRSRGDGQSTMHVRGTTAGAVVRIPRFGADYAVPLLEGTSDDDVLASGIGHVEATAEPGQRGDVVIAAHRVTHGEPFADMPEPRPGDEVIVETARATYTYSLDTGGADLTVPFTATWVADPRPVNPDGGV